MSKNHTSTTPLDRLLKKDPYLSPYRTILKRRLEKIEETENRLTRDSRTIEDFASGHHFFGLCYQNGQWIFREWAPNATAIYFLGDVTGWQEKKAFALQRTTRDGVWQINLPAASLSHGDLFRLRVYWPEGSGDRIPSYARRVVQDPETQIFNAQVWQPESSYPWRCPRISNAAGPLLIYEAHVGMAQEEGKVGSFAEFTDHVIPRIVDAGYNTIQLMAVQEHPYYGSFGYQVSNFFAVSSRFGTPEDLKALIDTAHGAGLRIIMDLIHSHAVSNEVEGLGRFDGTQHQYFHAGSRGIHGAWDSKCFDYGKIQVLHFLLSNCRFWLDEFRFDGFRFDGVTSMLYLHHGLNKAFAAYEDYFDSGVDEDALTYLTLANRLVHGTCPEAVTIAEDVSGMPGLAVASEDGGIGFDYRFAMGVPDYWTRLVKDQKDEAWHMGQLWFELTNRRPDEKTISYAESHDQALVGDQTLIFRLMGSEMYSGMQIESNSIRVDRGMALHKMIRFITLTTADSGYLNFMGNEFGHPEWIDFPRPGNNWSYQYARRQWHLLDDADLKYRQLALFDRDMIALVKQFQLLGASSVSLVLEHNEDKLIVLERSGLLFVFNFHPTNSYTDCHIGFSPGKYEMIFNTDDRKYGGHHRLVPNQEHFTLPENGKHFLSLYLPSRTALVLWKK